VSFSISLLSTAISFYSPLFRLVSKPATVSRKDSGQEGVIIREKVSEGVTKLQPRDVPFPFTTVRDYELSIRQPLGPDWNTPLAQAALIQPKVVTKAGRIIRALDKGAKLKMVLDESRGEEEEGSDD